MTDALHRDDGISYSTTLQVPDYTFDPTMHLQMKNICNHMWILPQVYHINIYCII